MGASNALIVAFLVLILSTQAFRVDFSRRPVQPFTVYTATRPATRPPFELRAITTSPILGSIQINDSIPIDMVGEGLRLCMASGTVGLAAAAAVEVAKKAISFLDRKIDHRYPLLAPLVGSLVVSLCYAAEGNTGKPSLKSFTTKEQFYDMCVKHVFWRYLALVASVGCGCSVGMAGPAAELGVALAYLLSQTVLKQYSVQHLNGLLLSGAAGGIAAYFNAPLTGCLFAWQVSRRTLHNPLGTERVEEERELKVQQGMLATAVLAAVVLVRKGRLFQMKQALALPSILSASPGVDLLTFGLLGLLCGALSEQYVNLRSALQAFFQVFDLRLRPLLGGLVNSFAVSMGMSQAASHGMTAFNHLLAGSMALPDILTFTGVKFLASTSSAASGLVGEWIFRAGGGPFTSSLLIGAGVGAAYHAMLKQYIPALQAAPMVPYVLAGASAMLSAYFNASFMATVFMVELTHRPELALVALYCTLLAAWTSQAIQQVKKGRSS